MKKLIISALITLSISLSFCAGFYFHDSVPFESSTRELSIPCDYQSEDQLMHAFICERDQHKQMWYMETILEDKFSRWSWLDDASELAYEIKYYEKSRMYALESLAKADDQVDSWNYGNAIHNSNVVLGRLSLREGDLEKAKEHLLKAAKSKGSPQLDTFGPSLELANELLTLEERGVVLQYLSSIGSFWEMDDGKVKKWIKKIENNEIPNLCNRNC
jgi:hypothetical protein